MNDTDRANVFRNPQDASTPEGWTKLREAVFEVNPHLRATNVDKNGYAGGNKWTLRLLSGRTPHNEADVTFLSGAREMVLSMIDEISALNKEGFNLQAAFDALNEGFDAETARLRAENDDLKKTLAEVHGLDTMLIESLRAEVNDLKAKLDAAENPVSGLPATEEPALPNSPEFPAQETPASQETPAPETPETAEAKAHLTEAEKQAPKPKRTRKPKTETETPA